MQKEIKKWFTLDPQEAMPRLWLHTEERNYLLSWAMITHVEAAGDFLSLRFESEIGLVQLSSTESMQGLFEYIQMERVRRIEGQLLACRIIPLE